MAEETGGVLVAMRVVALPGDPIAVHLVAEASRRGYPSALVPDYRAPTTVCGRIGFVATDRVRSACPECERGYAEAAQAAALALGRHLGGLR